MQLGKFMLLLLLNVVKILSPLLVAQQYRDMRTTRRPKKSNLSGRTGGNSAHHITFLPQCSSGITQVIHQIKLIDLRQ